MALNLGWLPCAYIHVEIQSLFPSKIVLFSLQCFLIECSWIFLSCFVTLSLILQMWIVLFLWRRNRYTFLPAKQQFSVFATHTARLSNCVQLHTRPLTGDDFLWYIDPKNDSCIFKVVPLMVFRLARYSNRGLCNTNQTAPPGSHIHRLSVST